MKSEIEIRVKLNHYRGILAGYRAGRDINMVAVFLATEQRFPGEGQAALSLSTRIEEAIKGLPPEDRCGIKEAYESCLRQIQLLLEERIIILKWVLGECDAPRR